MSTVTNVLSAVGRGLGLGAIAGGGFIGFRLVIQWTLDKFALDAYLARKIAEQEAAWGDDKTT